MKFNFYVAVFMLLSFSGFAQEELIFQESFEDTNAVKASVPDKFYSNSNDHFYVSNKKISNTTAPYSDYDGAFFWAAEDIDALGGPKSATIMFCPAMTKGYDNLTAKVLVATGNEALPDGDSGFDKADSLTFYYSVDGTKSYTRVLKFSFDYIDDNFNESIRQDLDFDGIGDGTYLKTYFQEFEFELPVADSIIIKVVFANDSDAEELAIDNLRIYGTSNVVTSTKNSLNSTALISPNPFNNKLTIEGENPHVVIANLFGQVLYDGIVSNGYVDTQHFVKGIYLVRINNQDQVIKMIKN